MKLPDIVGIVSVAAVFALAVTVMAVDPAPDAKSAAPAVDKAAVAKAQTLCPIEGAKIDKTFSVDIEGCRMYVCCKDCIDKVKADPKAALKKIAGKGEVCECICGKCGGAMAKDAACPADSMQCTKCKAMQKTPAGCAACPMKAKQGAIDAPASAPAPAAPVPAAPTTTK